MPETLESDGRRRVVIEGVSPEIDGGRFAAKRVVGDLVTVEADAFVDGHDRIACLLCYRREGEARWHGTPMTALPNDRWRGQFRVTEPGPYRYTVSAWVDHFATWRHDLARRQDPADIRSAFKAGAQLARAAAQRAAGDEAARLADIARRLETTEDIAVGSAIALDEGFAELMARHPDRSLATDYGRDLPLWVDRPLGRFSAWYEFFPRSAVGPEGGHGTFKSAEAQLERVAAMGFDVVYLPPIHPIGESNRKGRNNTLLAGPGDTGSPWAIGAREGGHKAVHPALGTLEDFRRFVARANELGLEVALDIAYQCSPDHPYVREHPEWFHHRPDGTIQYAENPPKKYQDVYPFEFETEAWKPLWEELKSVFDFWLQQGVKVFRVDNPHTKPFGFWEWAIAEIRRTHPETLFLSEAFTRPKVMYRLAKLGFTQSYTYFAWRNSKPEIEDYFTELTTTPVREFFRPNLWPNTPDILTEYLQFGGRPAFVVRAVLAATLGASWGLYGPAFELYEAAPREPGSEEYLDSEKYQIRQWDLDRTDSLEDLLTRLNGIRRENPALQQDWNLRFFPVDNEAIVCYAKYTDDHANAVLVAVNLDPHHVQSGWVDIPVEQFGVDVRHGYQMHDLLSGARYLWHGSRNFVRLDPAGAPAHVFRLRRKVRSEHDFDYFL